MIDRNQMGFPVQPIERVREGMTVLDAEENEIGTVAEVQMGDPDAAGPAGATSGEVSVGDVDVGAAVPPVAAGGITAAGTGGAPAGAVAPLLSAAGSGDAGEPDVPAPLRRKLLRSGYIKVDGPGLFAHDRYVPGDQIAAVSEDTVRLAPPPAAAPPPPASTTDEAAPVAGFETPSGTAERAVPVVRPSARHAHSPAAGGPPEASERGDRAGRRAPFSALGAALAMLGSAIAGWWYWRRRQEQQRLRHRLRRGLRGAVSGAGERLPDLGQLPPAGRPGLALLATSLLAAALARTLRGQAARDQDQSVTTLRVEREPRRRRGVGDRPGVPWKSLAAGAAVLAASRRERRRTPTLRSPSRRVGVGLSALAAGSALFAVRRIRRGSKAGGEAWQSPVSASAVADPARGGVQVHGRIVEEERSVQVPVTREEVVVERHPVRRKTADTAISADTAAETVRVPVRREEVTFEPPPVARGENEAGTASLQETEPALDRGSSRSERPARKRKRDTAPAD